MAAHRSGYPIQQARVRADRRNAFPARSRFARRCFGAPAECVCLRRRRRDGAGGSATRRYAQAHPFEQGNKRTAFEAMWHFLRINGFDLDIEDSAEWEEPVIS